MGFRIGSADGPSCLTSAADTAIRGKPPSIGLRIRVGGKEKEDIAGENEGSRR